VSFVVTVVLYHANTNKNARKIIILHCRRRATVTRCKKSCFRRAFDKAETISKVFFNFTCNHGLASIPTGARSHIYCRQTEETTFPAATEDKSWLQRSGTSVALFMGWSGLGQLGKRRDCFIFFLTSHRKK